MLTQPAAAERGPPAACGAAAPMASRRIAVPSPGVGHVQRGEAVGVGVGDVTSRCRPCPAGRARGSARKSSKRLPADHLDDPAEHVDAHRVVPLRARLEQQRQLGEPVADACEVESVGRAPLEAGLAVQRVDRVGVA